MKILIMAITLLFASHLQSVSGCIDSTAMFSVYTEPFKFYFNTKVDNLSYRINGDDMLIFCEEYKIDALVTPVSFFFYKNDSDWYCDILKMKDCQDDGISNILLDTIDLIDFPKNEAIWYKRDEYSPIHFLVGVKFTDTRYAVLHHQKCYRTYFEVDSTNSEEIDADLFKRRRDYANKLKTIADKIWYYYVNEKLIYHEKGIDSYYLYPKEIR